MLHAAFVRFQAQGAEGCTAVVDHVGIVTQNIAKAGLLGPLAKIVLFTIAKTKGLFIEQAYEFDGPQ